MTADDTPNAPIIDIRWSPPFEGISVPAGDHEYRVPKGTASSTHAADAADRFEKYARAYAVFQRLVEQPDTATHHVPSWQFRAQPGDLLCVDNRRMVHGRTAFHHTQQGVDLVQHPAHAARRSFYGCYLGGDEVQSTAFRMLGIGAHAEFPIRGSRVGANYM
eukprot:SAG31_NODE_11552_length_1018_cov_1.236126_1_plen_162_part_00